MSHLRNTLARIRGALCATVTLIALALASSAAIAQQGDWYPSRWGPDDQRGAANRLTPAKVLEAKSLIKQGTVYQLGRVYEPGIPLFGKRDYELRILEIGPLGKNQLTAHEGYFSGELDQVGTQFDGLGHIGIGDHFSTATATATWGTNMG